MPYHTVKRKNKYATVSQSGKTIGTHETKKAAQAQAFAVNVAEGYVKGVKPRKRKK